MTAPTRKEKRLVAAYLEADRAYYKAYDALGDYYIELLGKCKSEEEREAIRDRCPKGAIQVYIHSMLRVNYAEEKLAEAEEKLAKR